MRHKTKSILMSLMLISAVFISFMGAVTAAPPETPMAPRGPDEGSIHVTHHFSVRPVKVSNGHGVEYLFDWGDGQNSGWLGPYPSGVGGSIIASHQWTVLGDMQVTVKARNNVTLEESAWSDPHTISIVLLQTPGPISGPELAGIGQLCMFTVVSVRAPFDNPVYYLFDWDDGLTTGWMGPYPSGMGEFNPIEVYRSWDVEGAFEVRVKARDAISGDESAWSVPHLIEIGKSTEPLFAVTGVSGGFGITVFIRNWLAPSKYVDYTIDIAGGQLTGLHVHRYITGTVYIEAGSTAAITVPAFFALGRTKITVTAEAAGEPVASAVYEGLSLLFYMTNLREVK